MPTATCSGHSDAADLKRGMIYHHLLLHVLLAVLELGVALFQDLQELGVVAGDGQNALPLLLLGRLLLGRLVLALLQVQLDRGCVLHAMNDCCCHAQESIVRGVHGSLQLTTQPRST